MIVGHLLQEYPNNYVFEFSSRLLNLFGIKPNITRLIKQFDEQSIHHCSLIVPYCQMRPPGSGLVYSMNKHTAPVVNLDLTPDQTAAISLSDRIVVIDMTSGRTYFDVKLPKLNEPYLNVKTLTNIYQSDERNQTKSNQQLYFLLHSFHHIYFMSAHDDIKFERMSNVGYATVEILNFKRGLCIVTEINSTSVECWDLVRNQLFARIDSIPSPIKNILCIRMYPMIAIVCQDGSIHFYSIMDFNQSSFVHRGSIQIGHDLNLVVISEQTLVYTYECTMPIDFVYIDLKEIYQSKQILFDKDITKTSVSFDIAIEPRPIERIILPDKAKLNIDSSQLNSLLFMATTTSYLYVIHECIDNTNLSYARIDGHFDIVSMHENTRNTVYTARGGIIDIFVWNCVKPEDSLNEKCHHLHTYDLYASIDISSSSVTRIKPVVASTSLFLCSMENGVIHMYQTEQIREAYKKMPPFPRANHVIGDVKLYDTIAVTLGNQRRELITWSYQHSTSIISTRLFSDSLIVNDFIITSNKLYSNMAFVLVIINHCRIEIYSCESLNNEPIFCLDFDSSIRVHSRKNGDFLVLNETGSLCSIVQQLNSDQQHIEFKRTNGAQLKIQCSNLLSTIVTLDSIENLVVFDDNLQSIALWIPTNVLIYIDVNPSQYFTSTRLKYISTEQSQDSIMLHFDNKSLVLCRIELNKSHTNGFIEMIPMHKADLFCVKNNCIAMSDHGQNRIILRNIRLKSSYKEIQMENECEQMCFNESAIYIFTLIKPRILYMHRIDDSQQMAKLFLYDSVSSMRTNSDFVVLAMNDRRLLTLMIADPNDPNVQEKIHALPSRYLSLVNTSLS
ncbi:unnamed protein product [Rotaria socialis]|uniref:Uncharacterized protein n=1 Tax=Rotaria socialis TaxID=392032 RepID=A0A817YRB1_9BILA|nr:unnamed protein product [Rotaria socialis]CAF4804945.1 unnamed protein product [Rotaria socialis]